MVYLDIHKRPMLCSSSPSLMQFFLDCSSYVKSNRQANLSEVYAGLVSDMWSKKRYRSEITTMSTFKLKFIYHNKSFPLDNFPVIYAQHVNSNRIKSWDTSLVFFFHIIEGYRSRFSQVFFFHSIEGYQYRFLRFICVNFFYLFIFPNISFWDYASWNNLLPCTIKIESPLDMLVKPRNSLFLNIQYTSGIFYHKLCLKIFRPTCVTPSDFMGCFQRLNPQFRGYRQQVVDWSQFVFLMCWFSQ